MPTQQNDEYAETMRRLFAQRMNGTASDLERECNQLRSNNVQLAERAQALEAERDAALALLRELIVDHPDWFDQDWIENEAGVEERFEAWHTRARALLPARRRQRSGE